MLVLGLFILAFEISLSLHEYNNIRNPLEFSDDFFFSICISLMYFAVMYYSVLRKNCLTEQNLYGRKQSDSLCLLNFTETISGLIEPLSFLFIGTKALGIFDLRDNITFMDSFDMPIIENIYIGIEFKDAYNSYISMRLIIMAVAFFLTLTLNRVKIPKCCKKDEYYINVKINDMNPDNSPSNNICCCQK